MTGATIVPRDVEEYLADVRKALADVPAAERDDLLAEVEASLADAAAESDRPLTTTLGSPEDFAAELRSAAGLHPTEAPPRRQSELARRLRSLARRLALHPRTAALRRLGNDLAPIWWVARGYLAVAAPAYALDAGWSTRYPFVPHIGSSEIGVGLIAVAVVLSIWLGLSMRRRRFRLLGLVLALNAALVVAAGPVLLDVDKTPGYDRLVSMAYAPPPTAAVERQTGLRYNGEAVRNLYPFSRDGRLLHDVLLYDHRGRPLEIRGNRALDPNRRFVVTNGNRPLFNAFPIRYYEPGTRRVGRPNAAPYIELPLVRTPPVRARRR
jgi:hypothetical protein